MHAEVWDALFSNHVALLTVARPHGFHHGCCIYLNWAFTSDWGFCSGSDGEESACNTGDASSILDVGRRRKWQPNPVFLPGEFHGQRSLLGYKHEDAKSRTQLSDYFRFVQFSRSVGSPALKLSPAGQNPTPFPLPAFISPYWLESLSVSHWL